MAGFEVVPSLRVNKRTNVVSLARSRCRFNWSLSASSRHADFHHDDRLSSVALLKLLVPYFFGRYIFGGLEIQPVALELHPVNKALSALAQ
jgi:hypothetical protein